MASMLGEWRRGKCDFNATFPMGRWAHIACVYDGEEKRSTSMVSSSRQKGTLGRLPGARTDRFDSDNRRFCRTMSSLWDKWMKCVSPRSPDMPLILNLPNDLSPTLPRLDSGISTRCGRTANDWSGHGSHGDFIAMSVGQTVAQIHVCSNALDTRYRHPKFVRYWRP